MGGAWEELIKSVKRNLKAIALACLFTEEALHTFICEVESILNNRPISPSSNDSNHYEAPSALPITSCFGFHRQIMYQVYFEKTKSIIEKNGVQFK